MKFNVGKNIANENNFQKQKFLSFHSHFFSISDISNILKLLQFKKMYYNSADQDYLNVGWNFNKIIMEKI